MTIASRTPEGDPNRCPICGASVKVEPSDPLADAPCPNCGHLLWFGQSSNNGITTIRFSRKIVIRDDITGIRDHFRLCRGETLRLDFEGVEFLSSETLGLLIGLKKTLGAAHVRLHVQGLHPDLREVFRITRLDDLFGLPHE